ncbi:MAG: GGDEF domain-containing protein [Sulfuricaulis sp.]
MTTIDAVPATSSRPDPKVVSQLIAADKLCLAVATLIAATVLIGWIVPAVGSALPVGWSLMKINTALAVLLCTAALALTKPKRSPRLIITGRACAGVAMLLAGAALFEHWSGRSTGLGTLLTADSDAQIPGRMSIQTASFLVLLGLSLIFERTRQDLLGHVLDVLIASVVLFTLVLIAGYVFSAAALIGQSSVTRTSPQTLACLALLTFAQTSRRAPYGYFSVLVGVGIGSQFARIALPISQLLVFLFIGAGESLLKMGYLSLPYAAALTASSMAALLFVLIVLLARKINDLERALRDMSLADDLTGLHNRRGFYLLGEQALREARRAKGPLTVFYFDADGLKKVNDTLGHDVGSELLRDIATLLRTTFRSSDVVGRLGGDEFAVITHGPQNELMPALRRLDDATVVANDSGRKSYRISFSRGGATTEPPNAESFVELVDRADAVMYQDKRQRYAARESDGTDIKGLVGAKP